MSTTASERSYGPESVVGASVALALVVTAATPRPVVSRWSSVPSAREVDAALDAVLGSDEDWYDDPHGSPRWRRAVSSVFAHELRDEAAEAAGAPGTTAATAGTR